MRVCKVCKLEKTDAEMVISMTGRKKIHYKRICRICHKRNSDIVNELRKDHPYPDENYSCALCGSKDQKWYLDHDWSTGKFRAWLCNHCNSGLGNFKDDIDLLNKAIAYLSPNATHSEAIPKWYEHG